MKSKRFCSDNCRKRHHERSRRAKCPDCGGALGQGSRYPSGAMRCFDCYRRAERERLAPQDRELERLWADGKQWRDIAEHFGWAYKGRYSKEMDAARRRGANLPYRYKHHKNKPRHPEQVAA